MSTWRNALGVAAFGAVIAACGGSGGSGATNAESATTSAVIKAAPATQVPPVTEASLVTDAPVATESAVSTPAAATTGPGPSDAQLAARFEKITAPSDCMCSDGSEFSYFVHKADPNKVVFFLEGGGACFDAAGCGPDSKNYKRTVGYEDGMTSNEGVFELDNPKNPFAGYSMVFVPYCTGDVHIGNSTHDYGNGVVVQHKGFVNASTALNQMAELFPDANEVVVTGASAGSVPTPLYAGMTHDLLPDARITVLADGSGAYPDIPAINGVIGAVWGTMNAVPAWPENAGVTAETWSFPGLFVKAGTRDPKIVFARHDYAFDETQAFFSSLAGIAADHLVELIDRNEAEVEAGGVPLESYISAGHSHTVVGRPEFYTETLNGVMFVDWVHDLVTGKPVTDVHCVDCGS